MTVYTLTRIDDLSNPSYLPSQIIGVFVSKASAFFYIYENDKKLNPAYNKLKQHEYGNMIFDVVSNDDPLNIQFRYIIEPFELNR